MQLTPLEPEDLELLYTIENDTTMWNVSSTTVPYSRYALHEYLSSQTNDIYADKQVRLVARVKAKSRAPQAVALADLFNFAPQHLRAEVGIAVLSAHHGKGYGKQALHLLVDYARNVLHLHQLVAIVPTSNVSSIAMLQSENFQQSGTLRDWTQCADGHWQDAYIMQLMLTKCK